MGRGVFVLVALCAFALGGSAPASAATQPDPAVPPGLNECAKVAAYCGTLTVPLDRTGRTPGTTKVRFEWYPRGDAQRPSLGTVVALEGGPGYSTTDSRDYFLELFAPLLDRRSLLLVDQRGTGRSEPLDCPEAQSYDGNWVANAEACGRRLGPLADLYTSANAAIDLKAVLDSLGVSAVDVYGDSYGSFLAQTFAVRYPALVRTLVLDGTYPITGLDPWYRTTAARLRDTLELTCARSRSSCPVAPSAVLDLADRVVAQLRAAPLTTTAPDGNGVETTVTLTPRRVLDVLLSADAIPGYVRERVAAMQALLAGNARPLARMVAENAVVAADADPRRIEPTPRSELRGYSEGAYLAYACSDYPQLWNVASGFSARDAQYAATLGLLAPATFAPWLNPEWADSEFFTYDYCIRWPKPRVNEPPFPVGGRYPRLPTLVLNGDLDLRTDSYQAREVARNFGATFVEVPNAGHVTALFDADACAAAIARRFVETAGSTGNTSCLSRIPEHRLVQTFAVLAQDAPPATVASAADRSKARDRRAATVAVETVADVIDRWYAIPGYSGGGLYGGSFTFSTTETLPFPTRVWTLELKRLRWASDVRVTGTATVPRGAGTATATLQLGGAGTDSGDVTVTWPTREPGAQARVRGTIGGRSVDLLVPAPSFY